MKIIKIKIKIKIKKEKIGVNIGCFECMSYQIFGL